MGEGAPGGVIAVTGLGTVNALGAGGAAALGGQLGTGRSGVGPVRAFPVDGLPSRLAAQVDEAVLDGLLDRDAARRLSRICRLAVAAARLAVEDARLEAGPGLAIVLGSEHGDFRSSEAFAAGFLQRGAGGLSPLTFPNTVMNAMAAQAAIAVGSRGPTVTVNQRTVAGDLAIARAVGLLRSGQAAVVLAGGVDEICEPVYRQLARLGALSPMAGRGAEGCRPFAPDANGPVLGEGATLLVLEEVGHARARGARVHGVIRGAAWGAVPAAPHAAPARRRDPRRLVAGLLAALEVEPARLGGCWGSGNGDPALDDWERALVAADLGAVAGPLLPPRSLAPLFGQHGGLGALRVAAAMLGESPAGAPSLVHGIARGGCRTALVVERAA